MQEGFYDLLERLIKLNATHIGIWSHTNGSISKYKGKNIIDLLKQFDICEKSEPHKHSFECRSLVVMSHDGIGKRGEYIRYGLKHSSREETNRLISESTVMCWNCAADQKEDLSMFLRL